MKLDKNTEVSLKRKKEKREKEYLPPIEKTSNLNTTTTTTPESKFHLSNNLIN